MLWKNYQQIAAKSDREEWVIVLGNARTNTPLQNTILYLLT